MKHILSVLQATAFIAGAIACMSLCGVIENGGQIAPVLIVGAVSALAAGGAYIIDWLMWIEK